MELDDQQDQDKEETGITRSERGIVMRSIMIQVYMMKLYFVISYRCLFWKIIFQHPHNHDYSLNHHLLLHLIILFLNYPYNNKRCIPHLTFYTPVMPWI